MYLNQVVSYTAGNGRTTTARVAALSGEGNGPSGHKILDLDIGKKKPEKGVRHKTDVENKKDGYWTMPGED